MTDEHSDHDFLQTFIFDNSPIRGAIVKLDATLLSLFDKHTYTSSQKSLLAECAAATVLMTSHIKFDGLLSLQAKGNGLIKLLNCECSSQLGYRGLLTAEPFQEAAFSQLFQDTTLAITLEPAKGSRYQGIVPLQGDNLSECLQYYFMTSEQLPTTFRFASDGYTTIGLLIQALPKSHDDAGDDWQRINYLADTLSTDEMLDLDHKTWLYRLFHEEPLRLFDPRPVSFHCSCSPERFERALLSLDTETVQTIIAEDGKIETECQFCHSIYRFNEADIQQLLSSGTHRTNH